MRISVAHQLALFASGERILAHAVEAGPDAAKAEVRYVPAVFSLEECARYFAFLRDEIAWEATRMWMYDHEVDVPRMTAFYGADAPLPAPLESMRSRLVDRFDAPFNAVGMNLYRDERDSVAWHSDTNENLIADPVVAIVSFGAARQMQIRPKIPPRHAVSYDLEPGSVVLMTGEAQNFFEHCVPKVSQPLDTRASVVFRTVSPS
jgi:alkylated DNA repair dioxygenase AlkB